MTHTNRSVPETKGVDVASASVRPEPSGVAATGIYIASKTTHGAWWRALRGSGAPIISTWIDEAEAGATSNWPDLWHRCIREASQAAATIVYREEGEVLKGAFVEMGAALAAGRTVFTVGCDEFSVRHHMRVVPCSSLEEALELAHDHIAALSATPQGSLPEHADANKNSRELAEAREEIERLRKERDLHNGHRRIAEAKLMALQAGAVIGGKALLPVEPTEEMLAATCDDNGRMRVLEFTSPEERSAPFLVPRYAYRAMVKAACTAASALENGPAGLADANSKELTLSRDEALEALRVERERVEVLESAMEPFAKVYDESVRDWPAGMNPQRDDKRHAWGFNRVDLLWGDFRRARSVLAQGAE